MQVRALGMVWYRAEDWKAVRRVMSDTAEALPRHYKQWLERAEAGYRKFKAQGMIVEKVYLDPETFPDWCRARGMKIDAKARMAFANEVVAMKYRDQS